MGSMNELREYVLSRQDNVMKELDVFMSPTKLLQLIDEAEHESRDNPAREVAEKLTHAYMLACASSEQAELRNDLRDVIVALVGHTLMEVE